MISHELTDPAKEHPFQNINMKIKLKPRKPNVELRHNGLDEYYNDPIYIRTNAYLSGSLWMEDIKTNDKHLR